MQAIAALRTYLGERQNRAYYVAAGDTPETVLRKLGRQGLSVVLDQVRAERNGLTENVFVLGATEDGVDAELVVGPAVRYDWTQNNDQTKTLGAQIDKVLAAKGKVAELTKLIDQGKQSGMLDVVWDGRVFKSPTRVRKETTTPLGQRSLVQPK